MKASGGSTTKASGETAMKASGGTLLTTPGRAATEPKFDVCVDTLVRGCVQSFISLFGMSHRDPVVVDRLSGRKFSVPADRLGWLQERLMGAEIGRRGSAFGVVRAEYVAMVEYFEGEGDVDQAAALYEELLRHCVESLDRVLEGEVHEAYGAFCRRHGRLEAATEHLQTRARLAELCGDFMVQSRALRQLAECYMARGAALLAEGDAAGGRAVLERAVAASRSAGDMEGEARAFRALGDAEVVLGDAARALEYKRRFLVASVEGRGQASREVARLQEQLGHRNDAVESLTQALQWAEENNDLREMAQLCRQLGEMQYAGGDNVSAVHYLRQAFRVARDVGDDSVDRVRAELGFAMGEHLFSRAGRRQEGFLSVVCNDIPAYLEWVGGGSL